MIFFTFGTVCCCGAVEAAEKRRAAAAGRRPRAAERVRMIENIFLLRQLVTEFGLLPASSLSRFG